MASNAQLKLDKTMQNMVEQARTDLIGRHKAQPPAVDDVEVVRAEYVTWRSAAMGCPLPDRGYPMVLSPGVLIVLRSGGEEFEYHGSRRGTPFLCEPPGKIETPAPGNSSRDPT